MKSGMRGNESKQILIGVVIETRTGNVIPKQEIMQPR